MTNDSHKWHEVYEALPAEQRELLDMTYARIRASFDDAGFQSSGDDTAEELIAALTRYFKESGN
jgi:hypothetical protein